MRLDNVRGPAQATSGKLTEKPPCSPWFSYIKRGLCRGREQVSGACLRTGPWEDGACTWGSSEVKVNTVLFSHVNTPVSDPRNPEQQWSSTHLRDGALRWGWGATNYPFNTDRYTNFAFMWSHRSSENNLLHGLKFIHNILIYQQYVPGTVLST